MIAKTSNPDIRLQVGVFAADSEALLLSVIKNILNKIECAMSLKPFIVKVFHFRRGLKNNISTSKNCRIQRNIPEKSSVRGGFRQRGVN